MAVLSNPKWELFAQGLAEGKSQTMAYVHAGYSAEGASGNACHLLQSDNSISQRVDEILTARQKAKERALARRAGDTIDAHLDTLASLRDEARLACRFGDCDQRRGEQRQGAGVLCEPV